MNKTVQRIVSGLLILLVVIGMLPTVFATGTGLEELPTEPTEGNESIDITEPTQLQDIGDPDIADTPPASSMEEAVTASRISIGGEDAPMLFATRAAIKGTHYHRAIIWLLGSDAKLNFTYKNNNYSVDRLYLHGVRVDGENHMAYCIDPGVLTTESSGGYSGSETAWSDLDIDTQTAVGLAVLYGAPNGMSSSDKKTNLTYEFATQIIIHEILLGYRSNLPPYSCTDERIIRKFGANADGSMDNSNRRDISSDSAQYSSLHGQALDRKLLRSAYDQLAANMASHYVLPSFASRYNAGAKTYEMTKQSNGTYSVMLTDTNNILSKCTFQNGNGLTYTVSGNMLTITSSGPFAEAKSCAQTGSGGAAKNVPNLEKQSFLVWEAGSRQRLVTLAEAQNDPVPIYFNVLAKESKGTAKIIKTTTNGGTVSGWTFAVKNASGATVGTYTTDATGVIAIDLEPGTYSVTEKATTAKYWVNDATSTRKVTVKAGETASVTFTNQYRGQAQIVKTATNGGTVAGWHFTVKNSSGTKIGDYVTDSTGIITLDLDPGTYTVTETDGAQKYWINDSTPSKTVTVKAGETAKVTFTNQWQGQAQIVKTTTNGGRLDGWHFTVKNSSGTKVGDYVTDKTGIITLDLEPGTYTVTETDPAAKYWVNDPTPTKTVTVKAGETASVTFENQWIGKTKIIKTLANPEAGSVEGWSFTITDDKGKEIGSYKTDSKGTILTDLEPGTYTVTEKLEDGSLWQSITDNPQKVTVVAGKTAEVTFTNALRPGKISIEKVDFQGEPLSNVEFLLEWSADGKNWKPVSFTNDSVPQIGGCTTNGLKNGMLTTDKNGLVEFTGLYPTLQYRLTETKTQEGYQLLKDPIQIDDLTENDDLQVNIRVVNLHEFALPDTGRASFLWLGAGIGLCCMECMAILTTFRRKEA